jgi:hypothetical protein
MADEKAIRLVQLPSSDGIKGGQQPQSRAKPPTTPPPKPGDSGQSVKPPSAPKK